MSTILFHKIVFGPIKSRRLGNSLGINLLPDNGKLCSFDCVYCECGWNKDGRADQVIPTKEAVFQRMQERFAELHDEGTPVDTITFSGNGEPPPSIRIFPKSSILPCSSGTAIFPPPPYQSCPMRP